MNSRLIRLAVAAVALAAPLATGTAHAANVAVAVGTGTIDPGVPTTGCATGGHFEISGSAANLGTDFPVGPYEFTVVGDSTSSCPSLTADSGAAQMSGDVTGTLEYTRNVGLITLSGLARVSNSAPRPIAVTCEVAILDAHPVTSFAVVCAITL
jgi:hypothetical protein